MKLKTYHRVIHTTIKMSIASIISVIISNQLGLEYAITGGILAVLSIQLTKKDSFLLAFKRFLSAVIALFSASLLFVLLGYTFFTFTIFMMIFILASFVFKISEGIVPSLVLVSHLLIFGQFDLGVLTNGLFLIAIAIIVSLIVQLIYPAQGQKILMKYRDQIDQYMIDHIFLLSLFLKDIKEQEPYMTHFKQMNQKLKELIKQAELYDKDVLFDASHKYMRYLYMRQTQFNHINQMYEMVLNIEHPHEYAKTISNYLNQLSYDIGVENLALKQLDKLEKLKKEFKDKPLPETRASFETRAILFQMMLEIESFLKQKIDFHNQTNQT